MAQPPVFRERTEELERASLSTWATLALETKGRDRYEPEDPLRTVFQADRDRILACSQWEALADKSAALPPRPGRSRLSEVLSVTQVARTIARALRLNEDLTEAVALGQALGATPFASAGEEGIGLATGVEYRPEEQALRIVEGQAGDGSGLNLTWETRDGILHQRWDGPAPATLEGDVARFARRIVEVSGVLDDAAALGLSLDVEREAGDLGGLDAPERIRRLTADVATVSWDRPQTAFGARAGSAQERAYTAAREAVVASPETASAHARAVHCVASLGVFVLEGSAIGTLDLTAVVDVLAGATDTDLLARYRSAFEPTG